MLAVSAALAHEAAATRSEVFLNNGVSFGVGFGGFWGSLVAWLVVVLLLGERRNEWGWRMVVVGGAVNIVDRLRFGGVRDYWSLPVGLSNNLNDWLIIVGVIILVINLWKEWRMSSMKTGI